MGFLKILTKVQKHIANSKFFEFWSREKTKNPISGRVVKDLCRTSLGITCDAVATFLENR